MKLPGTGIMYLNAYTVTRHFGGREEGGWWYNWLTCVASVPVRCTRHAGCAPGLCDGCDKARERGSVDIDAYCEEPHCIPLDAADVEARTAELREVFADDVHGDIYSVLGGTALEVLCESTMAESQSTERPRYE